VSAPRTALVTGAGRGIGRAVAAELRRRGLDVLVTSRDAADARAVAEEIGARWAGLDVTDAAAVARCAAAAFVDVLVCNAGGLFDAGTSPLTVGLDAVERTLAVNLLGTWRVLQGFVPAMVERGYGRVVVVSSGTTPEFGGALFASCPGYSLSKSGLNGLTTMVAAETAGTGVLVNAVNPGRVRTRMMPSGTRTPDEAARLIADAALLGPDGPSGTFISPRTAGAPA
jgi:NAD(P)-dependent dehydrogenase (short-subunit alcohol dehydrogenase family)